MVDWVKLEAEIGVSFRDPSLLQQAFVHSSYLNENLDFALGSNERLEFLGDAILGLVIAESLYRQSDSLDEGDMTKLRAALVRQESLAQLALSLGLGDHLYLGQGEDKGGGRKRARNLACAMEALIGAVFVDQGFESAKDLIGRLFSDNVRKVVDQGLVIDYKSKLQELVQAQRQERPTYRVVEAAGPDHDKTFWVEVTVGGEFLGRGCGKSKQSAEKEAAKQALERWR